MTLAGQFNGNDESEHNDEWYLLGSRDGDNSVEEMFRKIEILQSQTRNLKSRLNKVMGENPGKFSLVDDLDLLVSSNGLTSSTRSLGSTPNNTDRMPVGSSDIASQLILQYNRDNMAMPESAVSSHGVVSHLPDKIERTNPSFLVGTCRNVSFYLHFYYHFYLLIRKIKERKEEKNKKRKACLSLSNRYWRRLTT